MFRPLITLLATAKSLRCLRHYERNAEELIKLVFKDVWKRDQVLFTRDRQLI